jgi:hypothetical protein
MLQTNTEHRSDRVILNVTDGTIQTCRTINITFSQYAMRTCNAMQYNAMQCNTMQCNTMQCNAMCTEVRPSVPNEVSQSFFFFFYFFF